jgi:hypothetical protein
MFQGFRFFCICALLFPAAARAILLGGTEVPREKFIVFILIGHSNMSGENHRHSDGVGGPRIWYHQWYGSKEWLPAREPPNHPELGLSGRNCGGPGMAFLKGMAAAYPDYHFGVISNATVSCTVKGVNGGHNGSEYPADGNRYWKGAALYEEIPAVVNPIKRDFLLGGIIAMLGSVEATRTSRAVCEAFSDDLAQMARDYRADLGEPNLPFIIGDYENGAYGDFSLAYDWPRIIDEQIKALPAKLPNSANVSSVGIPMKDDHHYTIEGEAEFARRVIAALRSKRWDPAGMLAVRPALSRNARLPAQPIILTDAGLVALQGGGRRFLADGKRMRVLPARRLSAWPP